MDAKKRFQEFLFTNSSRHVSCSSSYSTSSGHKMLQTILISIFFPSEKFNVSPSAGFTGCGNFIVEENGTQVKMTK